jgi:NTP pyrophosphatase (non-canonical NTP hydrolase)
VTAKEFEDHVSSRWDNPHGMPYLVIALNEEAGEVAGWYKKFVYRENVAGKHTLDDLKGELGDVLYYATRIAQENGWTLSDVMEFNKQKLDARVAAKMRIIA